MKCEDFSGALEYDGTQYCGPAPPPPPPPPSGCTDETAPNFDMEAQVDDGSCLPWTVQTPQNCGFCDCCTDCNGCQDACLGAGGWDDGDRFCSGGDVQEAPLKCAGFRGAMEYDGTQYCNGPPPPPPSGCMDHSSTNYDPTAEEDDGSCLPWSVQTPQNCGFCDCCADCSGCQKVCLGAGGWDDGDAECGRSDMDSRVDTTRGGRDKCDAYGGSITFTAGRQCETPSSPVNCEGGWGAYGDCSVTCGGGRQSREYAVTVEAARGGTACPAELQESQNCNMEACSAPPPPPPGSIPGLCQELSGGPSHGSCQNHGKCVMQTTDSYACECINNWLGNTCGSCPGGSAMLGHCVKPGGGH
jgi:hypothetical protein